jgi:transposase
MTRCICSTAYVFRQLVKARLAYPVSKSATVEYLKNHFDEDVSLSKIYRYLDKLSDNQHEIVQGISVMHTSKIPDGHIGVLFYDVTTLYFEADYEDDLRKTGFSKEGRHKNPQIIPGLLVSIGGYPLAYCIYEGNKYEGHTMLPVVTEFVRKYSLDDFIVVADSGLMNGNNIADLESNGYKYIIGAKIKNESKKIQEWILAQPKVNCQMIEYDKGNGQRLLVGYTDDRARKDAYNREKGIRRLEKAYNRGTLTKDNINKRGYNKFLKMEGDVKVSINYDKLEADEKWDGLKGYLTNTDIPVSEVYAAYHNLWHVERAFRISKSKIEIRPMFHFTRRRIEAHVCICFVALKVYKELERLLKLSNINMSVDKVLALAQTIVTIQVTLPQSKQTITRTMLMKRHQRIAPLFNDGFWGTH